MGHRDWTVEGELSPKRRNKHLNDLLRSKKSERHEDKFGKLAKRAKRKHNERRQDNSFEYDVYE